MRIDNISQLGAAAQEQILRKLGKQVQEKQKQQQKYRNIPTEVTLSQGRTYTFLSRKEAKRYQELLVLKNAGAIKDLKIQPQFTLQESYIDPEVGRVRAIRYDADFSYLQKRVLDDGTTTWVYVVEDVKTQPTRTQKYIIKRKLLQERFGITIQEI